MPRVYNFDEIDHLEDKKILLTRHGAMAAPLARDPEYILEYCKSLCFELEAFCEEKFESLRIFAVESFEEKGFLSNFLQNGFSRVSWEPLSWKSIFSEKNLCSKTLYLILEEEGYPIPQNLKTLSKYCFIGSAAKSNFPDKSGPTRLIEERFGKFILENPPKIENGSVRITALRFSKKQSEEKKSLFFKTHQTLLEPEIITEENLERLIQNLIEWVLVQQKEKPAMTIFCPEGNVRAFLEKKIETILNQKGLETKLFQASPSPCYGMVLEDLSYFYPSALLDFEKFPEASVYLPCWEPRP